MPNHFTFVEAIVLLGISTVVGVGWSVGNWLVGKVLR